MEKKIVGKCPVCGGDVVKTGIGYKCENNFVEGDTKCAFYLHFMIGNRHISDDEISELLSKGEILLDGFLTKEGKNFTTVLRLDKEGVVAMNGIVATCPNCHGDVRVNSRAFGCSNFNRTDSPCGFTIWRNIGGHDISIDEVRELCAKGEVENPVTMYREDGTPYSKSLKLTEDKQKIAK